ncbi:MAG: hypothetical protein LBJ09_03790 [Clostridiales bacterium]|jgi:hypothetical protein|nr:hypothetical protein [Clostridiales bacterium]
MNEAQLKTAHEKVDAAFKSVRVAVELKDRENKKKVTESGILNAALLALSSAHTLVPADIFVSSLTEEICLFYHENPDKFIKFFVNFLKLNFPKKTSGPLVALCETLYEKSKSEEGNNKKIYLAFLLASFILGNSNVTDIVTRNLPIEFGRVGEESESAAASMDDYLDNKLYEVLDAVKPTQFKAKKVYHGILKFLLGLAVFSVVVLALFYFLPMLAFLPVIACEIVVGTLIGTLATASFTYAVNKLFFSVEERKDFEEYTETVDNLRNFCKKLKVEFNQVSKKDEKDKNKDENDKDFERIIPANGLVVNRFRKCEAILTVNDYYLSPNKAAEPGL